MSPDEKLAAMGEWMRRLEGRSRRLTWLLAASILINVAVAAAMIRYGDRLGLSAAAKQVSAESIDAKTVRTERIEFGGSDKTWYDGTCSIALEDVKYGKFPVRHGLVIYEGVGPSHRNPIAIFGRDAHGLPGATVLSWNGPINIDSDEARRHRGDHSHLDSKVVATQEQIHGRIADLEGTILELRSELRNLRAKNAAAMP